MEKDELNTLQRYIDRMTMKRVVKAPFINLVRIGRLFLYQFTKDHRMLKAMKNQYAGQRCFIVGNGPSLTIADLEQIKGEHCFAFNRIYETFDKTSWRPEFYMVLDNDVMRTVARNLDKIEAKIKFLNVMGKVRGVKRDGNTIFFCSFGLYTAKVYAYKKKKISTDISRCFSHNFSVACDAIEAAIYMGFKEIIMIGFDNNYSRWVDERGQVHLQDVEDYSLMSKADYLSFSYPYASDTCFSCYRKYADCHDIKIQNATRGGKLEVFERVDFDELK